MSKHNRERRGQRQRPTKMIVWLALDETNEELLDSMRRIKAQREMDARTEAVCLIGECDNDTRELWEIPEVKTLCRRAFDIGFASYLNVFGKDWFHDDPNEPFPLGAFEMWMIAEGRIGPTFTLGKELFDEFFAALRRSNESADKAIGPMVVPDHN